MLAPGQLSSISYNHDEWEKGHDLSVAKEVKKDESVVPVPQSTDDRDTTANASSDQASALYLDKIRNLTRD